MDSHIIFAWISWCLLILIMIMRPIAQLTSSRKIMRLLPYRKHLGLACGFAAIAHAGIFLVGSGLLYVYMTDPQFWQFSNLFGWGNLALVFLLFPFVTSNRASQRFLKRRWKTMQKFAYPAFIATAIHVAFATGTYVTSLVPLGMWMILWGTAAYRMRHHA